MRTALRQCQLVQAGRRAYRKQEGGEWTIVEYDLVTVRGDSGVLRVRRLGEGSVDLECRVGVLGSPDAEQCVIDRLARRLAALRGVDYAPLDE
ncbi:MAG: hypothetical protein H6810_09775 [Phycisphaeraceae bacterium]|nr:MAG: hypothetical protein H6810_09775 [Phycisphaeraceae bacterium]